MPSRRRWGSSSQGAGRRARDAGRRAKGEGRGAQGEGRGARSEGRGARSAKRSGRRGCAFSTFERPQDLETSKHGAGRGEFTNGVAWSDAVGFSG
jgi:hypothetical protein